ncbi:MAG: GNAT family N-acetyltransferase [Pirellulaceae bacterium]
MSHLESEVTIGESRKLTERELVALYESVSWSSARKPKLLLQALRNSHTLVTARCGRRLIGLGNAISDGFLVVYYPHLVVHPEYQRQGVGRRIVERLQARYAGFHQQALLADGLAVEFYRKCGFYRAGKTEPMWIYDGDDH